MILSVAAVQGAYKVPLLPLSIMFCFFIVIFFSVTGRRWRLVYKAVHIRDLMYKAVHIRDLKVTKVGGNIWYSVGDTRERIVTGGKLGHITSRDQAIQKDCGGVERRKVLYVFKMVTS